MGKPRNISANCLPGKRFAGASLALAGAALAIFLIPGAEGLCMWHRQALGQGQVWRVFTCHFSHFSANHLLWDLVPFLALAAVCEIKNRKAFVACVLFSCLLISVAIWLALPGLQLYCGLSGIDSALFSLLALLLFRDGIRHGDKLIICLVASCLALFLGKVCFEAATGQAIFVSVKAGGALPVPLAHLTGAAAGIISGLFFSREKTGVAGEAWAYQKNL